MPTRVLLAGSDAAWLTGFACRVAACAAPEMSFEVALHASARCYPADFPPDVIVLDARNVQMALRQIAALQAHVLIPVLLACERCSTAELVDFIRLGARGAVAPETESQQVAKAIRSVERGDPWFARTALLEAVRAQLFAMRPIEVQVRVDDSKLTHRELEIMELIGKGLTNKEIARRLEISDQTVKTHLHRVYAKLHQSGRYKAFLAQPDHAPRNGHGERSSTPQVRS